LPHGSLAGGVGPSTVKVHHVFLSSRSSFSSTSVLLFFGRRPIFSGYVSAIGLVGAQGLNCLLH
jgi:hypothetical protein